MKAGYFIPLYATLFSFCACIHASDPTVGIVRPDARGALVLYTDRPDLRDQHKLLLLSIGPNRNVTCCVYINAHAVTSLGATAVFVAIDRLGGNRPIYSYSINHNPTDIDRPYYSQIAVEAASATISKDNKGYELKDAHGVTYSVSTCVGREGINIYLSRPGMPSKSLHYYVALGYDVERSDC